MWLIKDDPVGKCCAIWTYMIVTIVLLGVLTIYVDLRSP